MWVARFSLKYKGDIFTERTYKFQVNFHAYPLTHYSKGKKYFFVVAGIIEGEETNKKKFVRDLKKDKRVKQVDINEDFLTVLINYPIDEISKSDMETFYDSSLVHIEPILNSSDGREYWVVGSFEKENLNKVMNSAIELHEGKIISINMSPINSLSLLEITPNISIQQKKVISEAFKRGYYSYPHKIKIEDLAKILGISYSTCQEHLRRAEIALLHNTIKKL